MNNKQEWGQFFTKSNKWLTPQIKRFITKTQPKVIVDPFAGEGDLLKVCESLGFDSLVGFDIDSHLEWHINDSLVEVPSIEGGLVVTNPPFLAKNSATKNKLEACSLFKNNNYIDLYQLAIEKVLYSYLQAVFIIPETFVLSPVFDEYLESVTVIEDNLFKDTECPVCVCCFNKLKKNTDNIEFYKNNLFLFDKQELITRLNKYTTSVNTKLVFNVKTGNLGLRGIDGLSANDKIRFSLVKDLDYDINKIKVSSRAITVIDVPFFVDDLFLTVINDLLNDYRVKTHDIFLAPFKNNNQEGVRRRRIDFKLARLLINKTIEILS